MKVGILTYHASHNYGSMLQAYALQQTVLGLGHECEIINFRTRRQRRCYKPFWAEYPKIRMVNTWLRFPCISYEAYRKYRLFEKFLTRDLILSEVEYRTCRELEDGAHSYDAYISGSDQIWNVSCYDWDKAYGLGFVKRGRRIAYAPSMGPEPEREVVNSIQLKELGEAIKKYDSISVREPATARIVSSITGSNPEIALDPTLLLDAPEWSRLLSDESLVRGDYILLYTPWENDVLYQEAIEIGRQMNMKVVITMHYDYTRYHGNDDVEFRVATGPREFLNLIRNACLVVGGSFHAVAFAIIFGRQFYAWKGMSDSRVSSLLRLTGLERFAERPVALLSQGQLQELYSEVSSGLVAAVSASRAILIKALES